MLEFEAITAAGQYVTANANVNSDLFWALKGGGPGSYAVVLSVTMKTFPDVKSSGASLYINATHTTDPDTFWNGVTIYHKWSNHFVDSGLYAYWEMYPETLRVRPFVAIGKTKPQLQAILQPFLDELDANNIPYEFDIKQFPTFYDLYIDLFEDEESGSSVMVGGWMFDHDDVTQRNDDIIDAFKTVLAPRPDLSGLIIGHLFNPGYGLPVANSATHPAWRHATDFTIFVLPVPDGASLAQKADLQNVVTNTMDGALKAASNSGCTYVNEVSFPLLSPPRSNVSIRCHMSRQVTDRSSPPQADPYQDNWQSHFWGSSYPRLKQIREKWDPRGVFYAISTPGTEGWQEIEDGTKLCKKL